MFEAANQSTKRNAPAGGSQVILLYYDAGSGALIISAAGALQQEQPFPRPPRHIRLAPISGTRIPLPEAVVVPPLVGLCYASGSLRSGFLFRCRLHVASYFRSHGAAVRSPNSSFSGSIVQDLIGPGESSELHVLSAMLLAHA